MVPDPSGDLWAANCYTSGLGENVVRADARTREFGPTIQVPSDQGIVRGMAYGGGSLWVGDASEMSDRITEVEPGTHRQQPFRFAVAYLRRAGDRRRSSDCP